MKNLSRLAALLSALGAALPLHAMPYATPETWGGDLASRARLTGDWGGVRDDMAKNGVTLDLDLYWMPQWITSGGKVETSESWGNAVATLNVDTGKAGLWKGGHFKVQSVTSFGGLIYMTVSMAFIAAVIVLVLFLVHWSGTARVDALLMKNLTFLFGHSLVNITLYLGVAMLYELLPAYAGRPWKMNRLVAGAWNLVLLLVLMAYFHHLYMDFAQPRWMQVAGQIASFTRKGIEIVPPTFEPKISRQLMSNGITCPFCCTIIIEVR